MPLIRAALYLAVSGLFGSALLLSRRRDLTPIERCWLLACALACAGLSLVGLCLQTSEMNGEDASLALVGSVLRDLPVGRAAGVRIAAAACAALLLALGTGQTRLQAAAGLGGVAAVSLAWSGHGAAGEGTAGLVQLGADALHLLAAAFWIGAIVALLFQAAAARSAEDDRVAALRQALADFSGPGTLAVGLLAATGLLNAWRLVGPTHLTALYSDPYGRLLTLKLTLFAVMLAFAAANRWRHTAALQASEGGGGVSPLTSLQVSLALELAAGLGVLLVVGWMGTLPPPAEL